MSETSNMVREFHHAFNVPVAYVAGDLDGPDEERRLTLIAEEFLEVTDAIRNVDNFGPTDKLTNIAKELADLIYVIEGTALEYGIPLGEVFAEVHRSNMTKLGADGKPVYREDGKVLKGPNYEPANIKPIIERAMQRSLTLGELICLCDPNKTAATAA